MDGVRHNSNQLDLFPRYQRTIEKIVGLVRTNGYELSGFREGSASLFPTLLSAQQEGTVKGLEAYLNMCVSAVRNGAELKGDSQTAAWWVIRDLGWRPFSDVFSHIKPGDTIEIYDTDHLQIFRSFNMFRCISYSLDELVTHEWFELYHRPEDAHKKVLARIKTCLEQGVTIHDHSAEVHIVSEKFSPRRRRASYLTRFVTPLFDSSSKIKGWMNVIKAEPLTN